MSIGIGNLLNMFLHNGETNTVKAGVLHRSDPPQAILVESQADLEALGELPAGSIAYTSEYAHMWQLTSSGAWASTEEKDGDFAPDITNPQDGDTLVYNATAGKWVNGSGGGGSLVARIVGDSPVTTALDKTWQEIYDALVAGRYVLGLDQYEGGVNHRPINNAEIDGSDYNVSVGNQLYTANSADGYPAWSSQ